MTKKSPSGSTDSPVTMPALFVGHGSPMNAVENTEFSRAWAGAAAALPRPKAVLCVSAHWETDGTRVTSEEKPKTIHDFYGFPPALHAVEYPAPGAPDLARRVAEVVRATDVRPDTAWGLDHGAWSLLRRMFPKADIPVVQLSLDRAKDPAAHYALGRELRPLRHEGVLILGSGNVVHNLREMLWEDTAFDWAREFDEKVKAAVLAGDHEALIHHERWGPSARKAVPTNEHFLPLLYALALQGPGEPAGFFVEKVTLGSMSMRSLRVG